MKRPALPKRRQRRSGFSPYAKYQKSPFQYSAGYYSWRASVVRGPKKAAA